MLKALELSGFKSFADRTRFDFPPGITVVVGPNGSGKSNIVDGLKWVLGEQSAKSLRGKDMADVIFKGSGGPQGRKPANSAEATIILENDDRRFPFDHDEIRVTRRVFRSGESEYLINNEPVRLRDIRDLFRGTGVGTDAYSLIEQGKVERMLQSTSKDRRAIFEEAAGISRFKAKSVETQRRLARVEQNLLRLADIVEEVGSRYRSIKAQASKAVRYRQASTRLKLLRTHLAKLDYEFFQNRLEQLQGERLSLTQGLAQSQQDATRTQAELQGIIAESQTAQAAFEENQRLFADLREQIAAIGSEFQEKQLRVTELEQRLERQQAQWEGGRQRREQLANEQSLLLKDVELCEVNYFDLRTQLEQLQPRLLTLQLQRRDSEQQISELQAKVTAWQTETNEAASRLAATRTEATSLRESIEKRKALLAEYDNRLIGLGQQQVEWQSAAENLHRQAELKDSDLKRLGDAISSTQTTLEQRRVEEGELRSEQNGDQQRSAVIREMESQLEGVNSGVKQVLAAAKQGQDKYREVVGLVADLIQVEMQHALLIDLALGDVAQHVVLTGDDLVRAVARQELKVAGRVGLMSLSHPISLGGDHESRLPASPQVIGRAVEFIQAKPSYQSFVERLLGGTWIIADLTSGLDLREQGFTNVRLVTMAGEILEPDGRVIVGAKSPNSNLVSRRSELRLLKTQIVRRQERMQELAVELSHLKGQLENYRQNHQSLLKEQKELSGQLQELHRNLASNESQQTQARQLSQQWSQEQQKEQQRLEKLDESLKQDHSQYETLLQSIQEANQQLETARNEARGSQTEVQEVEKQLTIAKVQFAKLEQQLQQYQTQQESIVAALNERDQQLNELHSELQAVGAEHGELQKRIVELGELRQQLDDRRGQIQLQLTHAKEDRDQWEQRRVQISLQLESHQASIKRQEHRQLEIEGEGNQLALQKTQMLERLRDDYGLEIETVLEYVPQYLAVGDSSAANQSTAVSESEATPATLENADLLVSAERELVEQEIQQLRRKINNIGAVNMDALAELEDLESRYEQLNTQYQDLMSAKDGLHKIIQRINMDSRRIFAETLEAIRLNFQQLYRKTFGGGNADLILDESEDILESGIEIVATPPGKSEFNNSLLSGGEKALTAVSLLLAIFKYRPSPFCVLDEVDAPFDEANIGRFVDVLKEFLGWTRFVIVTHSKKTMTAATTLYGVTMQDSGVSKRVSIKFEEVSEDGQILTPGDPAAQVTR
ncbi:MAG: chromosome segregation protein SMC [Planctomycetaceae bacterium]|nr:chromosome segregation protein SMC [Planctomycetaceae bacterium]